jgi:hypothetical protein
MVLQPNCVIISIELDFEKKNSNQTSISFPSSFKTILEVYCPGCDRQDNESDRISESDYSGKFPLRGTIGFELRDQVIEKE